MKNEDMEALLARLPPGFVLLRKGGRPSKLARDAAVFLAIAWRRHMGDKPGRAEKWVLDTWRSGYAGGWRRDGLGAKEAQAMGEAWKYYGGGMNETAHVRSAAKRAKCVGLSSAILFAGDGFLYAVEVPKATGREFDAGFAFTIKNGLRCWFWHVGLPFAGCGQVQGLRATPWNPFQKPSSETDLRAMPEGEKGHKC